ncbi:glycosyltransferase family 2 protein [Bernardetia sp. ABR2-2B]|uniref:glycosyltransferase family 2 protein n=1 Tax=Bernardetia sp. ABR2-2B TaxID=3127472 RepID=UPI0030CBFE86
MTHKVSAVLIAYNEATIIEETLKALVWCDEIIVVDSGSTDRSQEIYDKYNCKVFIRDFDGFGTQKNFAFSQAKYDWILSMDADEVLSKKLQQEIQKKLEQETIEESAFNLPRTLIFLEKRIQSELKKPCLRLFNKNKGGVTLDKVHEIIKVEGKIGAFKNEMLHYSYKNIHDYFNKFNRYTTLASEKYIKNGKNKPKFVIIIYLPIKFIQLYILRGCFLNGFPGFVWSLFSSFYPIVKYIKLVELKMNKK